MSTETKVFTGLLTGCAVVVATAFIPKTAPLWVRDIVVVSLLLFLMAIAAVGAVAWERYGPNGYRVHKLGAAVDADVDAVSDEPLAVADAMRLYDEVLYDAEKRRIYRNTIQAVVSAAEDGDPEHLARFAESLALTIRLRLDPGYQRALRDAKNQPPARYEDARDVEDVIAGPREGGETR